jgi:DNA adenine methylase
MTVKTAKTPISYHGGKQMLVPKLLRAQPKAYRIYCEPFFGGGAFFFAKEPSPIEFINDINEQVTNFYVTAKKQFKALKSEIDCTLHSEEQFLEARRIYNNSKGKEEQEKVMRAWALFVLSHQTYLHSLNNTFAYNRQKNLANTIQNKKNMFTEQYCKRLESTTIFTRDALRVIKNADSEDTFHFIDPPYYNADMGHYDGYTIKDFENLLKLLENIKGKFLLTTYPSNILTEFTERNGWHSIHHVMHRASSARAGVTKTEVFTSNYPIDEQDDLSFPHNSLPL